MSNALTSYFNDYAESALSQIDIGLSAIYYYKEAIHRLENGIDISDSVPEIKRVGKKIALEAANELLVNYELQVKQAWNLPKSLANVASSKVSSYKERLENLPRYEVTHVFKLESGKITIRISTANRNHRLEIDTDRNAMKAAATISELEQYLMLAALST